MNEKNELSIIMVSLKVTKGILIIFHGMICSIIYIYLENKISISYAIKKEKRFFHIIMIEKPWKNIQLRYYKVS